MSIIIGIDHGYYAIKTAHCSFPAGLTSYGEHEPYTRQGLLEFGGCFFVCGTGRQPIQRDKTANDNYYLLTLAAIAKEIRQRGLPPECSVRIAAGLPLTSFGRDKPKFKDYLLRSNQPVNFKFEGVEYSITIEEVAIFPQGYAALMTEVGLLPGGFATGAGHGSTVCGPGGIYWHFGTIHLSINYKFERRLCMFPTFFDEDGVMYSDTYFGDYPHYSPYQVSRQTTSGGFRGWMLLSYGKPVKASSQLESYPVENVTDENLKTFWVAGKNDDKQWVEIDLEEVSDVYALQLNFFDYEETGFWGRMPNLRQRYLVEASVDGARWRVLVDYRNSFRDAPHNYIELDQPIEARYIRYRHHYVPGKNLAMGNIRVFGLGRGKKPATVKGFTVVREADERNVRISWKAVKGAQGYNVLWGVAPDKLYSSWMVYGDNSLDLRALTVGQKYYFAIEAFNENGISQRVFLREAH